MTVYDEGHTRSFWTLGKIESLVNSVDIIICGVRVRVISKGGTHNTLYRPTTHLFP